MRLLTLLVLSLVSAASAQTWTVLDAPRSPFVVDGDRYISYGQVVAEGQTRGVYVSDDAGATWDFVTAGLPTDGSASPKYLHGQTAFAASGPSGRLFRSLDGGRTWTDATAGLPATDPATGGTNRIVGSIVRVGNEYLARTAFSVSRSSDGGASWTPSNAGLPGYTTTGIDFFSSGITASGQTVVLASTLGLYRSGDGGKTWTLSSSGFASGGLPLEGQAVLAHRGQFYALANYSDFRGGVYRSDDDGRTWTRRSTGLPTNDEAPYPQGISQLRSLVAVGDALVVGVLGGAGLYRSTDGGDAWAPLDAPIPPDPQYGLGALTLWTSPDSGEPGGDRRLYTLAGFFAGQATLRGDGFATAAEAPAQVEALAVRVVPSPASARVVVSGPGRAVRVLDTRGRLVATGTVGEAIDVRTLPPGVYVARTGGQSAVFTVVR